jgi:hypothetical protein
LFQDARFKVAVILLGEERLGEANTKKTAFPN